MLIKIIIINIYITLISMKINQTGSSRDTFKSTPVRSCTVFKKTVNKTGFNVHGPRQAFSTPL